MYIRDPKTAFNLTDEQVAAWTQKLRSAMKKREASYDPNDNLHLKGYLKSSDDNVNVADAMRFSWNDCDDWVKKYSHLIPEAEIFYASPSYTTAKAYALAAITLNLPDLASILKELEPWLTGQLR